MKVFDLMVIGGGPGGYLAAERAGDAGLATLLIEKNKIGGVCLNEGCIPTKTLLHSAKLYHAAISSQAYGIDVAHATLSHERVIARKQGVVRKLVAGVTAKLKKSGVETIKGHATITGKKNDAFVVTVNDVAYYGKKLIIATGSSPSVPPIDGIHDAIKDGTAINSKQALDLTTVPKRLAVLGGGVIGLEMAAYYSAAGAAVTIFEMLDHIAGETDVEIGELLLKNLKSKGIQFNLSASVTSVADNSVAFETNGKTSTQVFDKVLVATGRKPNIDELGLDSIGVGTVREAIAVDEQLLTNIPGIYAVGDVNGKSMLAHTAYRQAEVAVNHILGKQDTMRYKAIPSVIYTSPEVASVGETQASAQHKGLSVKAVKLPMNYSGRYLAEVDKGNGICKLIVDIDHNRLLGVHLIGSYASEIIVGAAAMIEAELRIDDIKELVFPHPTVSEIIRETVFEI